MKFSRFLSKKNLDTPLGAGEFDTIYIETNGLGQRSKCELDVGQMKWVNSFYFFLTRNFLVTMDLI